jgi:hypothetical protein
MTFKIRLSRAAESDSRELRFHVQPHLEPYKEMNHHQRSTSVNKTAVQLFKRRKIHDCSQQSAIWPHK